jgi:hypothetical protein
MEKLQLCYTDVLDTLCDLTNGLVQQNDLDAMQDDLELIEKTSVILKRLGETQIIESMEKDVEDEA